MTMRSWIANLFASRTPRTIRKAPARYRPRLEALEDRTLLNSYMAATAADLIADIGLANAAGGTNTITLTAPNSSPYRLTVENNTTHGATGLPVIAAGNHLTIVGDGDTIERDSPFTFRLFDVAANAALTLKNLTLQGGLAYGPGVSAEGGAVYSQGALTLDGVTVRNNTAEGTFGDDGEPFVSPPGPGGDAFGGGVYVAGGSLTLTNATLVGNTARGGNGGNGINIQREPFGPYSGDSSDGGSGGNAAGGGVYAAQGAAVALTNATLVGNTARGGNGGSGSNAYFSDGYTTRGGSGGGGGNASGGGVFLATGSTTTLANTLIAENTLTAGTGGSEGDGIGISPAGSPGSASGPDVSGAVTSSNHSLIGDGGGATLLASAGDRVGTSANPIDPLLGPLQNNGGPTQTMALLVGSPAIDAGNNALIPGGVTTDQRGPGFARIYGPAVDIGAFELQPLATATAVTTSAGSSTYGDSVTFTATVTGPSTPAGDVNFVIDGSSVAGTVGGTTGTTATWTFTTSSLTAGTHTVEALYVGTGSFADSNGTLSGGQLVNKATATVVVTPYTVTYNGKAHTATVTSITGVHGETGATVGTVTLNTTHTSAGTYASDSWSFTGTANYNNIASTAITDVINKASSTTTVTIVGGPFTYSGLAQTPATVTVTGAGGLSLTPTASYANNVNAGTATASYSYAGDANHTGSSDSKNFTIGKAAATVVVSGYTGGTYDGSAHTQTVTVTGVPSDGQLYTTSLTGTNAGSYGQPWSYSNANYNPVGGTLAFTIAKANATFTVTPYTVTYDGSPHTATASAITGVNGETGAAVGTVTLSTPHTNAGTYSDSWSFTGAANYNNIASTTITDTINKATPTLTVSDGGIYTGKPFPATATAVGVNGTTAVSGSFTFAYYADSSASGTPSATAPTNSGTYTVVASFTSSDANYTGGTAQTTFLIQQPVPTLTVSDAGGTYTGKPFPASATAVGVDGQTPVAGSFTFAYYAGSSATGTSSATAPSNAGTYTVVAAFTSSDPIYSNASAQTTFTITPKLLEASAWSQGTINIGSNASIVLHVAIDAGQLYGTDTVASLFNGATFTIAIQKADGSVTYGTLTSVAKVESDGSITVSMQMNDSLRADLYDAYLNGRAVNFNMTATANGGNYWIDEDTMSKLLGRNDER